MDKYTQIYLQRQLGYSHLIFKINTELKKLYLQDHKKKTKIIINLINDTKQKLFHKYRYKKYNRTMGGGFLTRELREHLLVCGIKDNKRLHKVQMIYYLLEHPVVFKHIVLKK